MGINDVIFTSNHVNVSAGTYSDRPAWCNTTSLQYIHDNKYANILYYLIEQDKTLKAKVYLGIY